MITCEYAGNNPVMFNDPMGDLYQLKKNTGSLTDQERAVNDWSRAAAAGFVFSDPNDPQDTGSALGDDGGTGGPDYTRQDRNTLINKAWRGDVQAWHELVKKDGARFVYYASDGDLGGILLPEVKIKTAALAFLI